MEKKRSVNLILFLCIVLSVLPSFPVYAQEGEDNSFARVQAKNILETLMPAEKVGQLFLITFDGIDTSPNSEIYKLIRDFHIGGVVIKQQNGNIPDEDSGGDLSELIDAIQQIASDTSQVEDEISSQEDNRFIPLFIGLSQIGGSYPYDQIFSGIDPMPSPQAIGATWNAEIALQVGETFGSELESHGFNFLLGPPMDVLDMAYAQADSNLGVSAFGGDPYWVSLMGSQFITGLHRGSSGRLAVIAKNFPGRGSTDRLPEEEVSTVRKTLEQLKLIELAPFFKITNVGSAIPASITDGLVTSHIRYQGFQGNIRATTKPVSFDQNAIDLLMALPPINSWREQGGLLVSDDLGSAAISKFFDPNNQFIDARQVAKNAFLAGNDILFIDDLVSTGDANRFQTYQSIIDFFQQKYIEDSAFAKRVDDSVLRILTLKYEMYDEFTIDRVLPSMSSFSAPTEINDLQFLIAQEAATLIDPNQNQLTELIDEAPQFSDRIVVFSQEQIVVPCENCQAIDIFPINGIQRAVLTLYGPGGSGQINPNRIVSYSFGDLADYLDSPINRPELEQNFNSADWVVFAVRELNENEASSRALHRLIAETPAILRGKKVIVFSFDTPNSFDATEIAAFSAYYGLFSKLPAFFDVAARILFQELVPTSASPISIPGVGYDLITQLAPDPNQIITLAVDVDAAEKLLTEPQNENSPLLETPVFKLGDTLPVMTGVIKDHNGNRVPDGTPVIFTMSEQGAGATIQQVETQTAQGIAKAAFELLKPGMHEIKVTAIPADNSEILLLDISELEATVSEIIPTPIPVDQLTDGNDPEVEETIETVIMDPNSKIIEWFIATLAAWMFGIGIYFIIRDYFLRDELYLISGAGVIGGLFNMVWLVMDLPGTTPRFGLNGYVRMGMVVLLGVLMGAFIGWGLLKLRILHLGEEDAE